MSKETISFTIETNQLIELDALAKDLDRDRSSTLRRLIAVGMPLLRAANHVRLAEPLPMGAFPGPDDQGALHGEAQ